MTNKASTPKFQSPQAAQWCFTYNQLKPNAFAKRLQLLKSLLQIENNAWLEPQFQCSLGTNILLGNNVYANHNVTIEDLYPVNIGKHVLIGPHTLISTLPSSNNAQDGSPITLCDNVWVGAHVYIGPGVTIGEGAVIGAGSYVTESVPALTLAAGNPCRVIRAIQ
ncbi:sugar O-acetyltransferase [Alteromonas aestuariivivens]|uniref:Acetyltransferase n=1 Tax=Alteromonas aestuariivivens TaxID=1938339 RepID=A0A3D8M6Z4_9ALTE|nr:sugar O-acetyltransferase [Alteromonas aestuariivivens]RDV25552.1 sugar O-acetyltransferase [Alteromonas aestuariivivens]